MNKKVNYNDPTMEKVKNMGTLPPSPEMVCPKSTLCKYYTGENRCYWGIFVDDVKCNGNINRSDLFMCLNYSSPEPPEKVSEVIAEWLYRKVFHAPEDFTWQEATNLQHNDLVLTELRIENVKKFRQEADDLLLKIQQAGWGSTKELMKQVHEACMSECILVAEARQQALQSVESLFEPMLDTDLYWVIRKTKWAELRNELPKE